MRTALKLPRRNAGLLYSGQTPQNSASEGVALRNILSSCRPMPSSIKVDVPSTDFEFKVCPMCAFSCSSSGSVASQIPHVLQARPPNRSQKSASQQLSHATMRTFTAVKQSQEEQDAISKNLLQA